MSCASGDDELVAIMQHLPLAQRLGSCSLVSRQFRRAATAATRSISAPVTVLNRSSFRAWASQPWQRVARLYVSGPPTTEHSVPLPVDVLQQLTTLRSLQLSTTVRVFDAFWQQLSSFTALEDLTAGVYRYTQPSTVSAGILQATSLKRLSLHESQLTRSTTTSMEMNPDLKGLTNLNELSLSAERIQTELLAGLTQLVDLRLHGHICQDSSGGPSGFLDMLAGMTQLTRLQLQVHNADLWEGKPCVSVQPQLLTAITSSSKLQHLQLVMELPHLADKIWPAVLHSHLDLPELHTLDLAGRPRPFGWSLDCHWEVLPVFGLSSMPGLSHITALHTLHLREFELEPEALLALPQLRKLQLSIKLATAANAEAFVGLLPKMQQLTCLDLDSWSFVLPEEWSSKLLRDEFEWPIGAAAYQQHQMQHVMLGLLRLRGIWRHILARGLLPHLQSPAVGCTAGDVTSPPCGNMVLVDPSCHFLMQACHISSSRLAALVNEYPDLRSCAISLDPSAVVGLLVLSQLRGLTELP